MPSLQIARRASILYLLTVGYVCLFAEAIGRAGIPSVCGQKVCPLPAQRETGKANSLTFFFFGLIRDSIAAGVPQHVYRLLHRLRRAQ